MEALDLASIHTPKSSLQKKSKNTLFRSDTTDPIQECQCLLFGTGTISASSVYRNQNALVRAVFERAGDARKVLCVALDYAKRKHVALICDGHGDVLKATFTVDNNAAGIAHLIQEVSATDCRRKIPKDQIFLGGEDEAAYVANFTEALRAKGYLVVRVNAYEAKENRENFLASTDTLDLLGIAKTLLSRRARLTGDTSSANPAYHHLREITRCRRTLVRQQTAASNRIHALADQLFPGFLNSSKSALTPFCDASLELMKERFSAPEIARRRTTNLANLLRRHRVQLPDQTASRIILLARGALPPAAHHVATLQRTLAATVDLYQCLQRNAIELRSEAALTLATTPYVIFAAARHHLRLGSTLVKNGHPYLSPEARTRQATPDQIASAAHASWLILQRKWRTVSGGLDLILDEAHPLGFWRRVMLELHAIDLPPRP